MNSNYETSSVGIELNEGTAQALGSAAMPSHSVRVDWFRRDPGGGTIFIKPLKDQTGNEVLSNEAILPVTEPAGAQPEAA